MKFELRTGIVTEWKFGKHKIGLSKSITDRGMLRGIFYSQGNS
jgi:hypothetical protein